MKVLDKTDKERWDLVARVNPLIEEAFGKKVKGNYVHEHHSITDGPEGLKEVGRLAMIGKKRLGGFLCEYMGQLGASQEDDGSVIGVFSRYEEQAKRYAALYEREFKKEVTVVLVDSVSSSATDFFRSIKQE